eukprot:1140754-Pelagomonas_calceolata.AAC.9
METHPASGTKTLSFAFCIPFCPMHSTHTHTHFGCSSGCRDIMEGARDPERRGEALQVLLDEDLANTCALLWCTP